MWAYINNNFIAADNASISINDLALQRGYGVFDFFKTINYSPIFLDDHLNRLYLSAQIMHLDIELTKSELKKLIFQLIEKNNISNSGIKILITGGNSYNGYSIEKTNLILTQQPLKIANELNEQGISLITYSYQRQFPIAKTIDYSMGIWLQPFIKAQNADEVLYRYCNIISETPRANFFMVLENNTIITPKKNILNGITRKQIIAIAKKKYTVVEADISLNDIVKAKECFITSTSKQVLPVVAIDGKIVGNGMPGLITKWLFYQLQQWYQLT